MDDIMHPETLSCRKYLICGGAGFIGSHFVRRLAGKNAKAFVLDSLTYAGNLDNLKDCLDEGHAEFIRGDIRDRQQVASLLRMHGINAIVNFAAESHVDKSIQGPSGFIDTNIVGVFHLLEEALSWWKESGDPDFRFLQVSTDEVFGSLGPEGYFTETSRIMPNSPYSASKAAADHLTRAWHHTFGLPTITTHCSNNYGPCQYPEKLIPVVITQALEGKPIPVYGDGKNIRDWIYVEDHCYGIELALEKGKPGESYCFGGRCEKSNIDIVRTICAMLDRATPRSDGQPFANQISFVQDRLGHDRRYAIDDSFARRELGFETRMVFEEGLQKTVEWYLDNTEWTDAIARKRA
jgi:dTDP-glucose 4,6-dehydratase